MMNEIQLARLMAENPKSRRNAFEHQKQHAGRTFSRASSR